MSREATLCGQITLQASVTGDVLPELLRLWFDQGFTQLAPEHRRELESGPTLPSEALRSDIPCGPPGSAWGFVKIERLSDGRSSKSARVFSARSFSWFTGQLAEPPFAAALGTAVLDERGYPDTRPLQLELYRDEDRPDWCRLLFEAPEAALSAPGASRVWLGFLRKAADLADPSFGLIDYQYELYGETAVESTVGPPWLSWGEADETSREFLRGYGWVTILAQELADRLGGADALRRTGAFHEVELLARGGVWCLATPEYAQFGPEALLKVFTGLAPVLRPGTPRRFEKPRDIPHRVIYRDAADPGNSAPAAPAEIRPPGGKLVPDWAQGRRLGE